MFDKQVGEEKVELFRSEGWGVERGGGSANKVEMVHTSLGREKPVGRRWSENSGRGGGADKLNIRTYDGCETKHDELFVAL